MDLVGQGEGAMLGPPGHNGELSGPDLPVAVAQLYPKTALDNEEEFIFSLVVMPDELPTEFDELDVHVAFIVFFQEAQ